MIAILLHNNYQHVSATHAAILSVHKGRYVSTTDYLITIKVSHRQHASTNQVVIIRSITYSHEITEGCVHIWDPISVYKWVY